MVIAVTGFVPKLIKTPACAPARAPVANNESSEVVGFYIAILLCIHVCKIIPFDNIIA